MPFLSSLIFKRHFHPQMRPNGRELSKQLSDQEEVVVLTFVVLLRVFILGKIIISPVVC